MSLTTKKTIATVCVVALALGKAGILKNRSATTYHLNNEVRKDQLREYGAVVDDKRNVIDDNIIT